MTWIGTIPYLLVFPILPLCVAFWSHGYNAKMAAAEGANDLY